MRLVLIGTAVAACGGYALFSCVPAAGQIGQLPEPEISHRQDECQRLGGELLAVKVLPQGTSQVSHYNPQDNGCYVLVTLQTDKYQNHSLYDGKTFRLIAMAEIGTMFKWVDQSGLFMDGGGVFDSACAYINEKMEDTDLCADLRSWWLAKQAEGYKPTCEAKPCQ